MNAMDCLREQEVVQMVACGRWPDRCPEDLRAHVSTCAVCSDAVEVALAFREDLEDASLGAHVPPPGLVWWRAELRARQEAMRTVSRPMTLVQAFGGACTVGVAVALLTRAWPWLKNTLTFIDLSAFSFSQWTVLLTAALALLIIAPLAMYLVLSDE